MTHFLDKEFGIISSRIFEIGKDSNSKCTQILYISVFINNENYDTITDSKLTNKSYIPKTYVNYHHIKNQLQIRINQRSF